MNDKRLAYVYHKQGKALLPVKPGMRLEIHEKVGDGNTQRIWKFKGLVLSVKKPNHPDGTFTIRGEAARMTIEKIYPLSFPNFDKVLLLDEHKARRSKLYYMRDKIGKAAKLKSTIDNDRKNIDLLELAVVPASEELKVEVDTKEEVVADVEKESIPDVVDENVSQKTEGGNSVKAEEKELDTKKTDKSSENEDEGNKEGNA